MSSAERRAQAVKAKSGTAKPPFATGDTATSQHARACGTWSRWCMMCCRCWCHYGFQR